MGFVSSRSICVAAFLALWSASPAGATLIGAPVGAELSSPGDGLSLSDTVLVGAGTEIAPGDGSAIGGALLSTEFIDFDADRITLRLEEGEADGGTGYASGASYIFSGLYATAGLIIDDVMVTASNLSLGAAAVTFGPRQIVVPIDTAVIGEIAGIDFGTLTLDITTVVPEPATSLLLLGGLMALAAPRRRR